MTIVENDFPGVPNVQIDPDQWKRDSDGVPVHYKTGAFLKSFAGVPVVVLDVRKGNVRAAWLRKLNHNSMTLVEPGTIANDFNKNRPLFDGDLTKEEHALAAFLLLTEV